eukprot:scaffold32534_cov19-Tisochrysis_lutea.AAC.1
MLDALYQTPYILPCCDELKQKSRVKGHTCVTLWHCTSGSCAVCFPLEESDNACTALAAGKNGKKRRCTPGQAFRKVPLLFASQGPHQE